MSAKFVRMNMRCEDGPGGQSALPQEAALEQIPFHVKWGDEMLMDLHFAMHQWKWQSPARYHFTATC